MLKNVKKKIYELKLIKSIVKVCVMKINRFYCVLDVDIFLKKLSKVSQSKFSLDLLN